jgi:hypothetical protein
LTANELAKTNTQPSPLSGARSRRLTPNKNHSSVALIFHNNLCKQWSRLTVPQHLVCRVNEDKGYEGKYHATEIWHKNSSPSPILMIRVETVLGNKAWTSVWIGFHWRNSQNRNFETLPEAIELEAFCEKIYKPVSQSMRKGHWFGIAMRIENVRTDGGLASTLLHHEQNVHQQIAIKINNIWTLFGDKILAVNKKAASSL